MSRRDRQHTWRGALVAGGAFLLWPWCAEAHLVSTGLGPVVVAQMRRLLPNGALCCVEWYCHVGSRYCPRRGRR